MKKWYVELAYVQHVEVEIKANSPEVALTLAKAEAGVRGKVVLANVYEMTDHNGELVIDAEPSFTEEEEKNA